MYFADDAMITTNPELSSCRDSDKVGGRCPGFAAMLCALPPEMIGHDVEPLLALVLLFLPVLFGQMIGFISSRSKRSIEGGDPVNQVLMVNRYDPARAAKDEMLKLDDMKDLLGLNLIGVIPESKAVRFRSPCLIALLVTNTAHLWPMQNIGVVCFLWETGSHVDKLGHACDSSKGGACCDGVR